MSINRLKSFFQRRLRTEAERQAATPPGMIAVPTAPLTQISVDCREQRSVYEMAYLLARMGYVIEK